MNEDKSTDRVVVREMYSPREGVHRIEAEDGSCREYRGVRVESVELSPRPQLMPGTLYLSGSASGRLEWSSEARAWLGEARSPSRTPPIKRRFW